MAESPLAPHVATAAELQERLRVATEGDPYLVWRDDAGMQRIVSLAGCDRLAIGRRDESDVPLPWDERVSRLHAELERVGGEWVAVDDGLSTNGTWVGETRVVGRRRLCDGDLLRVGGTLIAFCTPVDEQRGTVVAEERGELARVSPAQRRVLVALCRPMLAGNAYAAAPTNGQLAEELYLSVDSVKTHMKALFEAFDLDDVPAAQKRAGLIERAVRTGSVTSRDLEPG